MIDPQITVLLIDDQPMIGEAIRRMLENEKDIGFFYCKEATKALQMADEIHPTVILQDLVMPDMDGLLLVRFLRAKDASTREVPLIVLSSKEDPQIKAKAFSLGANDYLVKLPDQLELIARLRYHSKAYINYLKRQEAEAKLKEENLRLSAELEVTRRLQQMILPKASELANIPYLDIAGFMEPASDVGGDYYDVLYHNGSLKIGIGDVTGHGLESGVLMLMVQTAIRTLMNQNETDPIRFLQIINQTIYDNVQRMDSDKNLSLSLLNYEDGCLRLSGQHESVILFTNDGQVELIDTLDLGFPIGLEENITDFLNQREIYLKAGDGIILYTDGITEAENEWGELYGIERLVEIVRQNFHLCSQDIQNHIINDVRRHIGEQIVYDDITLLVIKQK